MQHFGDIAFTEAVRDRQRVDGTVEHYDHARTLPVPSGLGPDEAAFIAAADSFYLASRGQTGWPYLQHRGGPAGFVAVQDGTHLVWAERRGNRQHVTAGNLDGDDRVALFFMDYPNRRRLKLFGHARRLDDVPAALSERPDGGRAIGAMSVEVVAFDWNCPKFITPRFTEGQVRRVVQPLQARIQELEHQLAAASPVEGA